MKGKTIIELFEQSLEKKYNFLNLSSENFNYFLKGIKIGATAFRYFKQNRIPTENTYSISFLEQVLESFANEEFEEADYYKKNWKIERN